MATTAPIRDVMPMPRSERPASSRANRPAVVAIKDAAVAAPARPGSESLFGLAASLILHLCLVIGMACVVFDSQQDEHGALSAIIGDPESELPEEFALHAEVTFDTGGSQEPEDLFSPTTSSFSDVGSLIASRSVFGGDGEGDGAGDEAGDGVDIAVGPPTVNVPAHAVTKGSFSAWTVPEDPKPQQAYFIIIQVRLPEKLVKNGKYKARDISGLVIGTDNYRQRIRFTSNQTFEVKEGVAQIEIYVPAAHALVRDTIQIQSRLLKEKQTLEIVF